MLRAGRNQPPLLFLQYSVRAREIKTPQKPNKTGKPPSAIGSTALGTSLCVSGPDSSFLERNKSRMWIMVRIDERHRSLEVPARLHWWWRASRQLRWRHRHYRHQKVGERIPIVKTFGIISSFIISNEYSHGGMNRKRGRLYWMLPEEIPVIMMIKGKIQPASMFSHTYFH